MNVCLICFVLQSLNPWLKATSHIRCHNAAVHHIMIIIITTNTNKTPETNKGVRRPWAKRLIRLNIFKSLQVFPRDLSYLVSVYSKTQCRQTPAFSVMLDGTLSFQPQYCCPRSHCDRVPHWLVQLPLTRAPYHLHHHQSSFLTHIIIIILTQDKTHMHPQHISIVSVSLVHWLTEAAVMVSAIWCWIRGKPPSPVGFLCGVWGWLMICTWISGLSSLQTLRP